MRRVLSEKRQNHNALYIYDSLGQKTCFQARLVFFFFFFFFFYGEETIEQKRLTGRLASKNITPCLARRLN